MSNLPAWLQFHETVKSTALQRFNRAVQNDAGKIIYEMDASGDDLGANDEDDDGDGAIDEDDESDAGPSNDDDDGDGCIDEDDEHDNGD